MKKHLAGRGVLSGIIIVAALMAGDATSGREPEVVPATSDCAGIVQEALHTISDASRHEAISLAIIEAPKQYVMFSEEEVAILAKVAYCESRGIESMTEIACVMWTILNRVDAGYASNITDVVMAPNQFAYDSKAPTVSDYGHDLFELAKDVLMRWEDEKSGMSEVGRVLPPDYYWYHGDGKNNWFRNEYRSKVYWRYSYESPYNN